MELIKLPKDFNYIGVFLTLGCNLSCSYCINHTVGLDPKRRLLTGQDWITALSRIENKDIPFSLQGGEPTLHPGIYKIISALSGKVDLLTNLQFDVDTFVERTTPKDFERDLPYPAIRVSYHPETMNFELYYNKLKLLADKGYSIGFFSVDHPKYQNELEKAEEICHKQNIIFKRKELLGPLDGKLYGKIKYEGGTNSKELKNCECRTSELLIAPNGDTHRCHHDLYNKILPTGNILSSGFSIEDKFRPCKFYGNCNPCDVKIKNNRFQQFGHTSVEIKNID